MDQYKIRPAKENDLTYINMICDEHGLGYIENIKKISVAVNEDDVPLGFIQIEQVDGDEGAYVYPVAVWATWQFQGVGSALVKYAEQQHGTLKLVACTESQDFYPRLGFEEISMEEIAATIAHDCQVCARKTTCTPKAFILKSASCTNPHDRSVNLHDSSCHSRAGGSPSFNLADTTDSYFCENDHMEYSTKKAKQAWQATISNCTDCGLCSARCELFNQDIKSMADIAQAGLDFLTKIDKRPDVNNATTTITIHKYAEQNPDTYAITRRCCLCDKCTALCPSNIQANEVMRPWRAFYQLSGLMGNDLNSVEVDKEWHLFSVYRHLNGVFYPEFLNLKDLQPNQADTLFFPGCTMVSYMDDLVRQTGSWLTEKGYKWALSDDCCGSPLASRGQYQRVEALQKSIINNCIKAGIKRIITVCCGCEMELAKYLENQGIKSIELIPLPKLLQEHGKNVEVANQQLAFFDSCHDRDQKHGTPLRIMFATCDTCKLAQEGKDTPCCGAGGAVSGFDAELVDTRAKRILAQAEQAKATTMIVSCPTCAFTFASQKVFGNLGAEQQSIECKHYLELVFNKTTDWNNVFAKAQEMWTGEYSDWVMSELL